MNDAADGDAIRKRIAALWAPTDAAAEAGEIGPGETTSREETEAWQITYLDTVTLLLTVFVLLLAAREFLPEPERTAIQQSIGRAAEPAPPRGIPIPGGAGILPAGPSLEERREQAEMAERMGDLLKSGGLEDVVTLTREPEGVSLEIRDTLLFQTGEASLSADGRDVLARLLPILEKTVGRISVEGHTDDVPIATARFPSNWDLSAARAITVVRGLISVGLPAERLRAIGYADTLPVTANHDAEGRAKNRRVKIVVRLARDR